MKLGDVCAKGKSNLRQKDLKNDGPYPVYGASGIVGFSSDYQNADAYVAVVKDGAGVGRVMACEPRSSVLGTMQALLPGKGTERDYLLHLVRSMDLGKGFTGSTIPHIYFKDYGKTLVRALSREQQVEVANRLSGIDHLISQGKGQLSLLDDLVKPQFVEMFGELAPSVSLASICELFTDGDWIESKDQSIGGIRLLQTGNVGNGKFRNKGDKARYITGETFDRLQCKDVLAGDILISRLPDPVGRACAVPESLGRCITAVDCSILRLKPEWNVSFVVWFTRTADYENQIREYLTGTTRKRISRSNLGKIKIPAADSELQQQFADFVARVDKLGFGCCRMTTYCDTLFSSVSARLLRT